MLDVIAADAEDLADLVFPIGSTDSCIFHGDGSRRYSSSFTAFRIGPGASRSLPVKVRDLPVLPLRMTMVGVAVTLYCSASF